MDFPKMEEWQYIGLRKQQTKVLLYLLAMLPQCMMKVT